MENEYGRTVLMEERFERNNEEVEIDLLEILRVMLGKAWLIILCLCVGAILAFGYTKLRIVPQYSATAKIYIVNSETTITSISDLQLGTTLTPDYIEVAKSRPVLEDVISRLDLKMTSNQLLNKIDVTNKDGTHILNISAVDADPKLAATISNTMSDVVADSIAKIINTDKPNVLESAVVPTMPISPNTKRNVMVGGLAGAAAAMAVIFGMYMMDDTIKTEEDVRKYLKLTVLAVLPLEKQDARKNKKSA